MFHVVIGCIHELTLSKIPPVLPDGRPRTSHSDSIGEVEYQLVTLPRLTSLLHG